MAIDGKYINQLLIINVHIEGICGRNQVLNYPKNVQIGLITSDRFKRFPTNLPIGESLFLFKSAMNMRLL